GIEIEYETNAIDYHSSFLWAAYACCIQTGIGAQLWRGPDARMGRIFILCALHRACIRDDGHPAKSEPRDQQDRESRAQVVEKRGGVIQPPAGAVGSGGIALSASGHQCCDVHRLPCLR